MIIRNIQVANNLYTADVLDVFRDENKIDFATVKVLTALNLKADKSLYQKPKVTINYGSSMKNKTKFTGQIAGLNPKAPFTIFCLSQEKQFIDKITQTYKNRTISEVAKIIAARHNLKIVIDNTTTRKTWHQAGESDLEFLAKRAKELNFQFYISAGFLYFKQANKTDSVFLDNFINLEAIWKDSGGATVNQGYFFDPLTKKTTTVSTAFSPKLGSKNTRTVGNIVRGVPAESINDLKEQMNNWGEEQLKIYVKVPGNVLLIPTKTACVQHGQKEFSGYYRIIKVHHYLKAAGFITEAILVKDDFGGNQTIKDPRLVDLTSKTRTIV